MPYFAPEAAVPITSCAPRLADRNANPQIHAGMTRPARKKSVLVFTLRLRPNPMPSTMAKYTTMMIQSIKVRFSGQVLKIAATHAAPSPCDDGRGADLGNTLVLDDSHAFLD